MRIMKSYSMRQPVGVVAAIYVVGVLGTFRRSAWQGDSSWETATQGGFVDTIRSSAEGEISDRATSSDTSLSIYSRVPDDVPLLYGFSSVAPSGEYTAPLLERYLRAKGDYRRWLEGESHLRLALSIDGKNVDAHRELAQAYRANFLEHKAHSQPATKTNPSPAPAQRKAA